jgi:hypothetical protein
VHARFSDSGGDLQDYQPHKGFSPYSGEGFVEELRYAVKWSREGSLLLLLLRRGASLTWSSHLIPSEVFTLRSLRKKRKKRSK